MAHDLDITPDIVTYGKVIGGGLPVGAIASTKSIMEKLAPVGDVYQAGTLSANPLAMIGGLSTLKQLNEKAYEELDLNAQKIEHLFMQWFKNYNGGEFSNYRVTRYKSLFWIVPSDKDLKSIDDIPSNLAESFLPLFETLLQKGIYLSPNAYEIGFVSLAHNKEIITELEKRLYH
jgi:glutamate-1-semialdehyde 2,1-aminomutase